MSAPSVLSCPPSCRIDLTVTPQEDSNPVPNSTEFTDNEYEFPGVPWYSQYDFIQDGLISPGPAPPVCVPSQTYVAPEQVNGLGGRSLHRGVMG
jgi:hypothetical protein